MTELNYYNKGYRNILKQRDTDMIHYITNVSGRGPSNNILWARDLAHPPTRATQAIQ